MPEEQSTVAPWQRMTIYHSTLPPPYEATDHLFEELPLRTYPSGAIMEPLAYEMSPGAPLAVRHRATRRWSCFLGMSQPEGRLPRHRGVLFVNICPRVSASVCSPTGTRLVPSGPGWIGSSKPLFPATLPPASASGRCALAALAALPARSGGRPQRLAARHSAVWTCR